MVDFDFFIVVDDVMCVCVATNKIQNCFQSVPLSPPPFAQYHY